MSFSEKERQRQRHSKYKFILLKIMSDNLDTHSHKYANVTCYI